MLRPANPHIICVAYCHIMRFAIYVTVSDVLVTTSIDLCVYRARFRCPGSPFRLFLSNRDRNTLEKSPIRPYRTISAITHRRNSGLLDLHTLSAHGMVCPGSQKEAKITNRDNEIWPGSHVNRLPSPPGHRLRIDKMLQCLTGMRPYRDSNVSLEVEESSSTPQTGSNAPNHRAPCLVWRITASSGVDVAGQQRNWVIGQNVCPFWLVFLCGSGRFSCSSCMGGELEVGQNVCPEWPVRPCGTTVE